MKLINIGTILLLLGVFVLAFAQTTLDEKISAILEAPPQERVTLMNELKLKLASMNNVQRAEAIEKMRSSMNQTNTNSDIKVQKYVNQTTQNQDMQMQQQMNQKQTATQAMKHGSAGTHIQTNANGGAHQNKSMKN